jgi:hypothetical protein
MPLDDASAYLGAFGSTSTLDGAELVAVVDTQAEVVLDDIITYAPAATVAAEDAPSAAAGQAFIASGTTYTVRQVLSLPPDGAFKRLVLARA